MGYKIGGLVRGVSMSAPAKPVLLALADYADEDGYAYPGIETLAFDTGYGQTAVKDALKWLTENQWIARKRRFQTSTTYRLNLAKIERERVAIKVRVKGALELAFDEESPGQPQIAARRLSNSREAALVQPPDGHESVSNPSEDPSVFSAADATTADPPSSKPEPTLNQRANALAGRHYERLGKMGNVPAFLKIIKKALEHGHADDAVDRVLAFIAEHNWTLTEERLANQLRGGPRLPGGRSPRPARPPTDQEWTVEKIRAWWQDCYERVDVDEIAKRTGLTWHPVRPLMPHKTQEEADAWALKTKRSWMETTRKRACSYLLTGRDMTEVQA